MKALTVQQPWAWAIIHGGKDVENRTTLWQHRGPLAIHAGMRISERGDASRLIATAVGQIARAKRPGNEFVPSVAGTSGDPWNLVAQRYGNRGAIIGVVDLVDVHHHIGSGDRVDCCDSPWAEPWHEGSGRLVHLVLENPRPLPRPVECKGRLGMWRLSADELDAVACQLREPAA